MIDIQGSAPLMRMKGIHPNKGIIDLPIICIRKNVTSQIKPLVKGNRFFAMYSTPALKDNPAAIRRAEFWCHCFKNPESLLPPDKPLILMSESDFIDPMFVFCDKSKKEKDKRWDFFYFTVNNDSGFENKGLHQFVESLKVLVLERKLKGLVIPYFPDNAKGWRVNFSDEERKILAACDPYLTYRFGWLEGHEINNLMQACKFGFFPNTVDCSPRLLTESLVRNVPILVNEDIWGGWKYATEQSGALFNTRNADSLRSSVDFILSSKQRPKKWFLDEYGFRNSSRRLAVHINRNIENTECTHVYFERFGPVLKTLRRRMRHED